MLEQKYLRESLLLLRLNNYSFVESNIGSTESQRLMEQFYLMIREEHFSNDFSIMNGKDRIAIFTDIPEQSIDKTLQKIINSFQPKLSKLVKEAEVDVSYGISTYPDDSKTADKLLEIANKDLSKE